MSKKFKDTQNHIDLVEAAVKYLVQVRESIMADKLEQGFKHNDTDDAEVFAVAVHLIAKVDVIESQRKIKEMENEEEN